MHSPTPTEGVERVCYSFSPDMNEEMSAEALVLFNVSRKDERLERDWLDCVCGGGRGEGKIKIVLVSSLSHCKPVQC